MDYDDLMEAIDFLALSRSYRIMRLYHDIEPKNPRLVSSFSDWLLSKGHEKEKDIALRMIFAENMARDCLKSDKELEEMIEAMINK